MTNGALWPTKPSFKTVLRIEHVICSRYKRKTITTQRTKSALFQFGVNELKFLLFFANTTLTYIGSRQLSDDVIFLHLVATWISRAALRTGFRTRLWTRLWTRRWWFDRCLSTRLCGTGWWCSHIDVSFYFVKLTFKYITRILDFCLVFFDYRPVLCDKNRYLRDGLKLHILPPKNHYNYISDVGQVD